MLPQRRGNKSIFLLFFFRENEKALEDPYWDLKVSLERHHLQENIVLIILLMLQRKSLTDTIL